MLDLKKILSLIADTGQKLFKKSNIKKNNLDSIIKLCDELLSNKGMVLESQLLEISQIFIKTFLKKIN